MEESFSEADFDTDRRMEKLSRVTPKFPPLRTTIY
jgi:hypothetical protein